MNKTMEDIAHRAANEIVNTAKQDVDRVEVIVRQAMRDGIIAATSGKPANKKNPNRDYVSE